MPPSATPSLPDFCSLETFHQLLSDSLMPWLSENNDPLFYKAWQHVNMRQPGQFFTLLRQFYASGNRPLVADLRAEWKAFEGLPADADAMTIVLSIPEAITASHKQLYYFELVNHTFLYSYSLVVALLRQQTDAGQRYELHQLLRRLQSLQQKSREQYGLHGQEDGMIIYWVHLLLQVLQREMVRRYPSRLMRGQTLLPFQPLTHASDDETFDSLGRLIENWYRISYPALRLSYHVKRKTDQQDTSHETASTLPEELPKREEKSSKTPAPFASGLFTSSDEAAGRLGISRTTLIKLARAGAITSIKIGKLYKFPEEAIQAYLHPDG